MDDARHYITLAQRVLESEGYDPAEFAFSVKPSDRDEVVLTISLRVDEWGSVGSIPGPQDYFEALRTFARAGIKGATRRPGRAVH